MNSKELSNGLLRTVAILASIALVFFLIYQLSSIIIYLIVSVLFTLLGNPIVEFLQKRLKLKYTSCCYHASTNHFNYNWSHYVICSTHFITR